MDWKRKLQSSSLFRIYILLISISSMKSFGTLLAVCLPYLGKQGVRGNCVKDLWVQASPLLLPAAMSRANLFTFLSLCFVVCEVRVTAILTELFWESNIGIHRKSFTCTNALNHENFHCHSTKEIYYFPVYTRNSSLVAHLQGDVEVSKCRLCPFPERVSWARSLAVLRGSAPAWHPQ